MFGWLWEGRDEAAQRAASWAGVMSLPRVLLPRSDGALGVQPAPELRSLRGQHTGLGNTTVSPTSTTPVELQGAALEIVAENLPRTVEATLAFLREAIPQTQCALDDQAGRRPEGLVIRALDRSQIAKLRVEDYERTLRRRA